MKNFWLTVFTSVILFSIIEISLRTFVPMHQSGDISNYEYNEDLGIVLRKNLNNVKITDHRQEVITNNFGTLNYENNFSNYDKLIFSIGDSNTMGTGVPFDSSYPFILFTGINSDDSNNWGVVNLALAAFGTKQTLLSYDLFKKHFDKPTFVTYLADQNDHMGDYFFNLGQKHGHLIKDSPRFFGTAEYLGYISNYSEILKRIKYLIHLEKRNKNYHQEEIDFNNTFIKHYANKIINFNSKLKEKNIVFIFSWHSLGKKKENVCGADYEFVKNWTKENNIIFSDWCPYFKKITKINDKIPVTNDHSASHARSWVNRIIAKSFKEKILDEIKTRN